MSKEYLEIRLKSPARGWYLDSDLGNLLWFTNQVEKYGCEVFRDGLEKMVDIADRCGIRHLMWPGEYFILYEDGQGEAWERVEAETRFHFS